MCLIFFWIQKWNISLLLVSSEFVLKKCKEMAFMYVPISNKWWQCHKTTYKVDVLSLDMLVNVSILMFKYDIFFCFFTNFWGPKVLLFTISKVSLKHVDSYAKLFYILHTHFFSYNYSHTKIQFSWLKLLPKYFSLVAPKTIIKKNHEENLLGSPEKDIK